MIVGIQQELKGNAWMWVTGARIQDRNSRAQRKHQIAWDKQRKGTAAVGFKNQDRKR